MPAVTDLTDIELVSLLKEGDKDAYAEIYNRFKGVLYIHAYRMLNDKEEAKDVVHEIFSRIWTKREQLNFNIGLSAYLYASVRNRIFDRIAHKKIESEYLSSLQSSHRWPVNGGTQTHVKPPIPFGTHRPPLRHGF